MGKEECTGPLVPAEDIEVTSLGAPILLFRLVGLDPAIVAVLWGTTLVVVAVTVVVAAAVVVVCGATA